MQFVLLTKASGVHLVFAPQKYLLPCVCSVYSTTQTISYFHKWATINFCRIKVAANHSTEFQNEIQLLLIFRRVQFSMELDGAGGSGRNKNTKPELKRRRIIFFSFGTPPPEKGHMCEEEEEEEEEEEGKMCPAWRQDCVRSSPADAEKCVYISAAGGRAHFLETLEEEEGGGIFSPFWLRLTFTRKWRERFDGSYYSSSVYFTLKVILQASEIILDLKYFQDGIFSQKYCFPARTV